MALEKIEGWSIREVLGGGAEGEEEELEGEYEEGWEEREKMEVREEGISEGMEALLRIGVTKGRSVLTYGRGELMKIEDLMRSIGTILAQLHSTGIIHGDLTTSNMMLRLTPNSPSGKQYEIVSYLYLCWNQLTGKVLIDFGLSSQAQYAENYAVDLYVLERAFASTHPASEGLYAGVDLSSTSASDKS